MHYIGFSARSVGPGEPLVVLNQVDMEKMAAHAKDAAGLMKALGNESRLMILCTLAGGERSVGELNDIVPLSQSALSQQLARLRQQGLVETRRESQTIYYSLVPGPTDKVIHVLHDIFCGSDNAAENRNP